MEALFLKLLHMSVSAAWLVGAVIVLRLCFRGVPKAIHCALWALVAVRLLCPVSIESSVSLVPDEIAGGEIISSWMDTEDVGGDTTAPAAAELSQKEDGAEKDAVRGTENGLLSAVSKIWLAGAAAMLLYAAVTCHRIRSAVRLSIHTRENIWRCEQVDTPFVMGVFRPRIYLPLEMDERQTELVLAHERAHLRRGDHIWKLVGFVLLSVYWFSLPVWVAYILFCRDMELACDEMAVSCMDTNGRKAYSMALLDNSVPHRKSAVYPLAFGEVDVKRRIAAVLRYKKPAVLVTAAALLVFAVVAVCLLTDPASEGSSADIGGAAEKMHESAVDAAEEDALHDAFFNVLGYDGYVYVDDGGGVGHQLRTYYAVSDNGVFPIAVSFGFGDAEDYAVDLDGDGITELITNVQYGGDGAQRVYVYRWRGDAIVRGELPTTMLPASFDDWGANATWSEYVPENGVFRLHYAQKGGGMYAVWETNDLKDFVFYPFDPEFP
ncbi:MAG: hypothetical protein IJA73_01780 [Oscillospiraceae bacterium]|nr:hypothetical protein [Oscillospiraceae bacterium]